ncbi:MAG: cellulose binding domain-containing protein, partial [Pseudomonadota bacterium]
MFGSDFTVVNDWGGGFQGRFTLDNRGMDTTNGWVLTFRASFDIAQIWGGRITSRVGDLYTVEAFSWNSGIGPGQSVEIGFIGEPGGPNTGPSDVMVNGEPTSGPGDQPDPPAPLPIASIADTTVDEGDDAIISVTLTEPAAAPVVLTYETRALTAGSDDFSVTTQTITIAEGQS